MIFVYKENIFNKLTRHDSELKFPLIIEQLRSQIFTMDPFENPMPFITNGKPPPTVPGVNNQHKLKKIMF